MYNIVYNQIYAMIIFVDFIFIKLFFVYTMKLFHKNLFFIIEFLNLRGKKYIKAWIVILAGLIINLFALKILGRIIYYLS